jgi:hypothetical protein
LATVNFDLANTLRLVTVSRRQGPAEEGERGFGGFMAWIDAVLVSGWIDRSAVHTSNTSARERVTVWPNDLASNAASAGTPGRAPPSAAGR